MHDKARVLAQPGLHLGVVVSGVVVHDQVQLQVLREAERVLPVPPVRRPARRLHVRDVPRLRSENAEERRGNGRGPRRGALVLVLEERHQLLLQIGRATILLRGLEGVHGRAIERPHDRGDLQQDQRRQRQRAADQPNAKVVEGSDGLLLEIDGQIVPNYDATFTLFEEGEVVTGRVVRIDNDDGIILDYGVQAGNPPDAPQLAPAISRIAASMRAGCPETMTPSSGASNST